MNRLVTKIADLLSTRTFAFAWTGLLFAFYGGMYKNAFPTEFGSLMLASACFVMGGYMIGSSLVNHLYRDMVDDWKQMATELDGNIDNVRGMQQSALMAITITDRILVALEGEVGADRIKELVRNVTEEFDNDIEKYRETLSARD